MPSAPRNATSLSIAFLLNPRQGKADAAILEFLELDERQLPELLPVGTAASGLTAAVAGETGLSQGIPVSVAIHDQYAASLGAGSVGAGDVSLGTGTAWVLVANTDGLPRAVLQGTFVCPHPVEGLAFWPLLSPGSGHSAFEQSGGRMTGIRLAHGPRHVLRAAVEGPVLY